MHTRKVMPSENRQSGEARKAGPVNYFAAFDCLNEEVPVLIGFVRQPAKQRTNLESMDWYWARELNRNGDDPGGMLQKAGFDAVSLSMRYRPATLREIAAYDKLSAELGGRFRFITASGKAMSPGYHFNLTDTGVIPAELTDATWGGPLSQLLIGSKWRAGKKGPMLFDFVRQMPPDQRDHVLERLIDLEAVPMHSFASNAADAETTDPVVLSSSLRDVWQFQTEGLTWTAQLDAGAWLVRLTGENDNLMLQLIVEGREFVQQLAPFPHSWPRVEYPYAGRLSSLLNFMDNLAVLCRAGRTGFEAKFGESCTEATGPYWYRKIIENALHGFAESFMQRDRTKWPNLKS